MVQVAITHQGQGGLDAALARLARLGQSPAPLMRAIANYGENSTRLRFERQTGPDGQRWQPSRRARKSGGATLKLSRRLLRSITSVHGSHSAAWGTNVVYGRIHQLGGVIERAPYSTKVRLRTDRQGNLLRQGKNGRLARFAKDSHQGVRESWHEVRAFKIRMPARPYLGVNRADLWEMGRLAVQVIRQAEAGAAGRAATPGAGHAG
jgi:phage virion morphogenesis protein